MLQKIAILILACFILNIKQAFSLSEIDLINKSNEMELYKNKEWLSLLHYKNNKSIITDKKFFLSDKGRKNPQLELNATILAFFDKNNLGNLHAICKYPMRYKFIKEKLSVEDNIFPKINCQNYIEYKDNLSAKEIYIIYASENLRNPASMMGHLFLRIDGNKNGVKVSNSLAYFANYVKGENFFFFYLKSIFVGTSAYYYIEPYNNKILTYNIKQKRNLWEYKLNLSKKQLSNFIDHLWEVRAINIHYNFVKHNCGTAVESLLNTIDPEIKTIQSNLNTPIETVRKLQELGYINDKIGISPSKNYKYQILKDNLTKEDKKTIKQIINEKNPEIANIYNSQQQKSNILTVTETLLDDKKDEDLKSKINNELYYLIDNNLYYNIKNPLMSNDSTKLILGYEKKYNKETLKFNFAPVYNDLDANNYQYFNEFELKMLNLEGNYYLSKNKIKIDNFDIIKLKNISPSDSLLHFWSSQIQINFEKHDISYKSNKMFPNITLGIGKSTNIFKNMFMPYIFLSGGYSYYNSKDIGYIVPEIGFFIHDTNFTKFQLNYKYYISSDNYKYEHRLTATQSIFLKRNHEIYVKYELLSNKETYNNFFIGYGYYF